MNYPSIRIEGAILSPDVLERLEGAPGQQAADFGLDRNARVKDEIARAWADAQDYWRIFQRKLETLRPDSPATTETRQQWVVPLLGLLGYQLEYQSRGAELNGKTYAISHRVANRGQTPVHITGCREPSGLDRKPEKAVLRMSAHAMVQEYLTLDEDLYGLVTNGRLLRLLRDSSRLVKLTYLEFDLDRIFTDGLFADFAVLYRLLHATRLPASREAAAESLIERYHQDSLDSGSRIRDGLSRAVEQAIRDFANGFLAHPANETLRNAAASGELKPDVYYQHLLRLIYRLLFLMVIEERGLVFPPKTAAVKRDIYDRYYSVQRLRRLSSRADSNIEVGERDAPLVVANSVDKGLAVPIAALKSHRPRSATVFDSAGDILTDRVAPVVKGQSLLIQMSGEARRLASMIVLERSDDFELRALVHQTQAVQELMRSGKQAQLRASLAGLSSGTGDLVKVIAAVERVIFDEPEIENAPRRRSPAKGPADKDDEEQTKPESLAGSIQDQRKRRAHRRLLESGDLAYLLDALIRRLGVGLERDLPDRDDKGRSEEELAGTDDAVDHPPEREEMDHSDIAKLCRSKTRRLVGRMVKQMEQAARRAEKGPTVLIQLVAVLAIVRELRLVGRMPRWASIRESLVNHDDEELLLDEVLTNLFGRGFQLYDAIKAALGDERFDELARLKGLLIWLAWDCEVQLDERFDIREEPEDVRQRLVDKAALLEFAQMLKGDAVAQEEAANSILQTVQGGAAAAASRWIASYFGWANKLSRIAIPTAPQKGKPNAAIAVGDLAVLTTEKSPKLRVVSSVTGQQVSLIDFGDEDGEIEFLRDRVVKLAR